MSDVDDSAERSGGGRRKGEESEGGGQGCVRSGRAKKGERSPTP